MDGFFDQYRSIRFGPITVQNIFCQKETEKTEQKNYQTVIHRSQLFLNRSNCFLTVHSHLQPLIKKRNGTTIKTVDFDKFYSKLFDDLGPKSKLNWIKPNFTDINDCSRLSVLYRVVYFLVRVFILTQKFRVLCSATPQKSVMSARDAHDTSLKSRETVSIDSQLLCCPPQWSWCFGRGPPRNHVRFCSSNIRRLCGLKKSQLRLRPKDASTS